MKRQKSGEESVPTAYNALLTLLDDGEQVETKRPKNAAPMDHGPKTVEGADEISDNESDNDEIQVGDDNEGDSRDPFEFHFASVDSEKLSDPAKWTSQKKNLALLGDRSILQTPEPPIELGHITHVSSVAQLKLKYRLLKPFADVNPELSKLQQELAGPLFGYQDILVSNRTWEVAGDIENLCILHAINHVYKTRDRILKNNGKLADDSEIEVKDQAFTRPKVLVLLPSRNSAYRFVEKVQAISGLQQCENKKRFKTSFYEKAEDLSHRPPDFQKQFEGNTNDLFCLGLKFTRQAVRLYASFYSSDIVIASPLGLRMIIGAEGDRKREYDFLSSIEIVLADQLDAIQMQSWQNCTHVFKHINLMPKEPHGCDFSRVREWGLDQKTRMLRQTVLISAYATPEMSSLLSKHCHNVQGKLRCRSTYKGTMSALGIRVRQVFTKLSCTFAQDPDERFNHFTSVLLPGLLRGSSHEGTLIYVPSYLDFVRIRNYMDKQEMSFVVLSEYTQTSQVSRGRTYFTDGRSKMMLYSQRLHHFRRFIIKGCKTIVFYGLPDNPIFYQEIVRFLARTAVEQGVDPEMLRVMALYSKWDSLKLERVVGTNRVGPLIEGLNDMYEFY